MLSRNLEQTLHRALSLASDRRHEYATLEHLLLGLADDTDAATVLKACGVDLDKLRNDLTEFLDKDLAGRAIRSRPPVSSVSSSVPRSTCSPPAATRSPAPTYWSPCSVSARATPST